MANLVLCTQADVYDRFGGEAYLTQEIDPQRTGVYSQSVITKAILDASDEVAAYCQVQVDLRSIDTTKTTYPQIVVMLTANIAAFYCWRYGSQGRAMPDPVQFAYDRAVETLGKIARRELSVGAPDVYPAMNQVVTSVNFDNFRDPLNRGRNTLKGFRTFFC